MNKNDNNLKEIYERIKADSFNASYTASGYNPVYTASSKAKILLVGQAPGKKAQETEITWNDKSGDNLRSWLGVSRAEFYDPDLFALVPMDFYYPGKGNSGDLPPRRGFAEKWHPEIIANLEKLELIVLIGSYATKYYLKEKAEKNLTLTIKNYLAYLPEYFPLVHPSPLNFRWQNKNPWFLEEVVPELKKVIAKILKK